MSARWPMPAVVNSASGSAAAAREVLRGDARFVLHEAAPNRLEALVRQILAEGHPRLVAAGGDGTIASIAGVLAGGDTEMAVLPGGTLNHFARALGIPVDARQALELAARGHARAVDAAYVGERLFLNTSSVGAYVTFVRLRERLRPALGYWLGSFIAATRIAVAMPRLRVTVQADDRTRVYRAPLVFVGVGQRTLRDPLLAERVAPSRPGLHVVVVRTTRMARLVALGLAAARGGATLVERHPDVDAFLVDRCTVALTRAAARVATDGELALLPAPLEYRSARGALRVVVGTTGTTGTSGSDPIKGSDPHTG